MTGEQIKRMETLIAFLEKLKPEKFKFYMVREERTCGTVGCAIGWTPNALPSLVRVASKRARCQLAMGRKSYDYHEIASRLFGLSLDTAWALFTPDCSWQVSDRLPMCGINATAKQVAKMLRKFLRMVDAGQINLEANPHA